MTVALARMDVADRGARLQARLDSAGCDALVVTHLTNIRYLTGFTGSSARLVVQPASLTLITDGRYEERARAELAAAGVDIEIAIGRDIPSQDGLLRSRLAGADRVGLEAEHVSWAEQRGLVELLGPAALIPTAALVEDLRAVKDPGELERIAAACAIADAALAELLPMLTDAPTEIGFARALDAEIRRRGADDISFDTIVAAGPNAARPHHAPTDRTIAAGDLVIVDFGALVEGYHSDMTRTIAVGGPDALDATQRRMVEVVTDAQAAGVAAVSAGAPASDVDRACREVIAEAGWGDEFVHGTGHGVGLDIHEAPGVNATSTATLADGHVVTVEPGVYLPGHGGVRVEDTVVVTPGGARALTRAPKH